MSIIQSSLIFSVFSGRLVDLFENSTKRRNIFWVERETDGRLVSLSDDMQALNRLCQRSASVINMGVFCYGNQKIPRFSLHFNELLSPDFVPKLGHMTSREYYDPKVPPIHRIALAYPNDPVILAVQNGHIEYEEVDLSLDSFK